MLASGMVQADVCMLLGTNMKVTGKKVFGMVREVVCMLQGTSTKVTVFQSLAISSWSMIGTSKIAGETGQFTMQPLI